MKLIRNLFWTNVVGFLSSKNLSRKFIEWKLEATDLMHLLHSVTHLCVLNITHVHLKANIYVDTVQKKRI